MYEYEHCSFMGTYWIPCRVIAENETHVLIVFKDPINYKYKEKLVLKASVRKENE